MRKFVLITVAIFAGSFLSFYSYAQQDPLYSQYLFNQQVINPAYTGINNNTNVTAISRLQWLGGVDGNPLTNSLGLQTSLVNNKVGLGALFVQDKLGVANNFEFHVSGSYKIFWADKVFAFGMQGGLINVNYNFSDLRLRSAGDPAFNSSGISSSQPNIGAGMAFMSDKMFIGLSAPRLLNTDFSDGATSNLRYRRHFYGSFSYILQLNSVLKLKPGALLRSVEGAPISYDVSALLLINNIFWTGAYTRNFDSVGLVFQIDYLNAYRFGYNFEYQAFDGFGQYTTHEFMLSVDLALFGAQDVFQRYF